MLQAIVLTLQWLLLGLIAYNLITALWGWPTPPPPPPGERRRRFVVAIPAHDEANVVAAVVGDVLSSNYPPESRRVWVIADRCTDATAAVARTAGAEVAERTGGDGGKGAALAWFLTQHPLEADTTLVVFDADNRVPPGLLARFADEIDSGAGAIQAYVDTTRPEESWVSLAAALSYWAGNRMVSLSRHNLEWSVDLAGTGMAITAVALTAAGGFTDSLVEDRDLSVRLALEGIAVRWVHDVRVGDQKPASAGVMLRQRARWAAGNRSVARRHLARLLATGLRSRRWRHWDQALRLVQPGRAFVALLSAALAVAAVVTGSDWLLPAAVWLGAALVQFVAPLPFLRRDRVPWNRVAAYPLLAALAALWIPVQFAGARVRGWRRTPHR